MKKRTSLLQILDRFGPLLALIAVYLLFVAIGPDSFASMRNIETIARQSVIVGSAALGMTLVIILGGIDLSIGSTIALTTVVTASSLNSGASPVVAALHGIIVATLCGLGNGFAITRLRVTPFIVTLGTLLVVRGIAKGVANEQKIDAPLSSLSNLLAPLAPDQRWLVVAPGVWIVIGSAILVWVLLHLSVLGRYIFAIGSSERAARLCGVPVERVKLWVYGLSGTFAGIAGVFQFSRLTVGDPTVAGGLELDTIAAVVIGGGSLSGGEGSIVGSLVGAVLMTVIRSGCSQMGLPTWVQEIVTGVIIVTAVGLDRLRVSLRQSTSTSV